MRYQRTGKAKAPRTGLHLEEYVLFCLVAAVLAVVSLIVYRFATGASFLLTPDTTQLPQFLGSLAAALCTILAVLVTVTLVAAQLAASAYTPRVMSLHTKNAYFIVLVALYTCSICYLFVLLGDTERQGSTLIFLVNFGILASLFCVAYLVPFIIHTVRYLMPENIIKALVDKIDIQEFKGGKQDDPRNKFQPVEDMVIRATNSGDRKTVNEGLRAAIARYNFLIDNKTSQIEAYRITKFFADFVETWAMHALQSRNFQIAGDIIASYRGLAAPLTSYGLGLAANYLYEVIRHIRNYSTDMFEQGRSDMDIAGIENTCSSVFEQLAKIAG